MLNAQIFILQGMISLFGIGDTSDAYLSVLVTQSASQLAELQSILKTADITVKQLDQAVELAEKMQTGIDKVLKPIEKSRQFQRALMQLKDARSLKDLRYGAEEVRDYMDSYKALFPEKSKKEEERRNDYENFEKQVSSANRSDLDEIEKLEREISNDSASGSFSPARAQQLSTQIQLKQWESQVLLREQIQRLIDENNTLKEEVARKRRQEEIQNKLDRELVQKKWQAGWKEGM